MFPCHVLLEKTAVLVPGSGTISILERKSSKVVTANSPLRLEQSLVVIVLGVAHTVCLNSACLFRRLNSLQPLFPGARDIFYKVPGSSSLLNIRQSLTEVE